LALLGGWTECEGGFASMSKTSKVVKGEDVRSQTEISIRNSRYEVSTHKE